MPSTYKRKHQQFSCFHNSTFRTTILFSTLAIGLTGLNPTVSEAEENKRTDSPALETEKTSAPIQSNVNVTVESVQNEDGYQLNLSLDTSELNNEQLLSLSPKSAVAFFAPELGDFLRVEEPAVISVDLLPLTMEDLPDLSEALTNTIEQLTNIMDQFDSDTNVHLDEESPLVNGLDSLYEAIHQIDQTEPSLPDSYTDDIEVKISPSGVMTIDFPDEWRDLLIAEMEHSLLDTLEKVRKATIELEVVHSNQQDAISLENTLQETKTDIVEWIDELKQSMKEDEFLLKDTITELPIIKQMTVNVEAIIKNTDTLPKYADVYGAVLHPKAINPNLLKQLSNHASLTFPTPDIPDGDIKNDINANDNENADKETDSINIIDAPMVNPIDEKDLTLTGKGLEGFTIHAFLDDQAIGSAQVQQDGSFEIALPEHLSPGAEIMIFQEDEKQEKSASVYVPVESKVETEKEASVEHDTLTAKDENETEDDRMQDEYITDDSLTANDPIMEEENKEKTETENKEKEAASNQALNEDNAKNSPINADETDVNDHAKQSKLPVTATNIWSLGLTGALALISGFAVRLFNRMKRIL